MTGSYSEDANGKDHWSDEHDAQIIARGLSEGSEIIVNDRIVPLVVKGSHERQQTTGVWRYNDESKYHTVYDLAGNGTSYHLLCTWGSVHGPMLYKQSDWDEDKTDKLGNSPKYSRGGERVESLEVL